MLHLGTRCWTRLSTADVPIRRFLDGECRHPYAIAVDETDQSCGATPKWYRCTTTTAYPSLHVRPYSAHCRSLNSLQPFVGADVRVARDHTSGVLSPHGEGYPPARYDSPHNLGAVGRQAPSTVSALSSRAGPTTARFVSPTRSYHESLGLARVLRETLLV